MLFERTVYENIKFNFRLGKSDANETRRGTPNQKKASCVDAEICVRNCLFYDVTIHPGPKDHNGFAGITIAGADWRKNIGGIVGRGKGTYTAFNMLRVSNVASLG